MPVINIDGLKVTYHETGLGLPVVLLPGLIGSYEWYRYQFSGLGPKYRIISCDLRIPAKRPEYSIDLLVEDLAKVLAAMRLYAVVIGGHSFGGLVAQKFALTYPQSAAALVLISSFPKLPGISQSNAEEILAPLEIPVESPIQKLFGIFTGKRHSVTDESESTSWLASHAQKLNKAAISARAKLAVNFDNTDRLGDISVPTLVTVGGNEHPVLLAAAQTLDRGIPDATLEVIEGGDHFSFYSRHDLFNSILDDWITSNLTTIT